MRREGAWKSVLVAMAVLVAGFTSILGTIFIRVGATDLYVGGIGPGNYTSIQAAIDAANAGDTVHVFSGTYYGQVRIDKTISLTGEGRSTTIIDGEGVGFVVRVHADSVTMTGFTVTNGSSSFYGAGIVVDSASDCRIDGNAASKAWMGIFLYHSTNSIIVNNAMDGVGIAVYGDSIDHWRTHSIDTTNTVNGKPVYYWKDKVGGTIPAGAGEVILANSTRVLVEHQNLDNGSVGVEIGFSSNNTIANNTISSNWWSGIYVKYSDGDKLVDNIITGNFEGVVVSDSINSTVIRNTVSDNRQGGIWLVFSRRVTAVNNTVTRHTGRPSTYGIICGNCDECTIAGNDVSLTNGSGMYLQNSGSSTVAENKATRNWYGISVDFSNADTLVSNTLIENGVGVDVEQSADIHILGNIIERSGSAAVSYYRSSDGFIGGNFIENNYIGISVAESSHVMVDGNSVFNSSYYKGGIFSRQSDGVNITNNLIAMDVHGIAIEWSTGFEVRYNTMLNTSIYIEGYTIESWNTHTIDTSNTVAGKPVYYLKDVANATVPPGAGEVILANSTGVLADGLNASGGSVGILLGFSSNNDIRNSTFSETQVGAALSYSGYNDIVNSTFSDAESGVEITDSSNNNFRNNSVVSNHGGIYCFGGDANVFANNTIHHNERGMTFLQSGGNMVVGNDFTSNIDASVIMHTGGNSIYHNNFWGGGESANDSAGNSWDNGYPSGGNFWSDYTGADDFSGPGQNIPGSDGIGDTPRPIKGGTYLDRYPLMAPSGPGPWPPLPPLNLHASAGDGQVTLTWDQPLADGGSPITKYSVYRGTVSGGETLLVSLGNVLTYTNTGLTNGQTYYYHVTAWNIMGESAYSSEANATPAMTPSEPLNLTATAGDGQVTLTWSAPASDGGSPITNYSVYRGSASGGEILLVTLGNVLTYTDTDVTNGQTYYYRVSASNGVGEGGKSSEVTVQPTSETPTGGKSILEETWFWLIVAAMIIVIMAVAIFATRRKRGQKQAAESLEERKKPL